MEEVITLDNGGSMIIFFINNIFKKISKWECQEWSAAELMPYQGHGGHGGFELIMFTFVAPKSFANSCDISICI